MHTDTTARRAGYPWHMRAGWWLQNPRYLLYMLRELSAVFAALWVVLLLTQLPEIAHSPSLWVSNISSSPGWIIFSFVALLFVLYHAWTAFTATGTLLYLRVGKTATPPGAINSTMLIAWAIASIVIGAIILTPILVR